MIIHDCRIHLKKIPQNPDSNVQLPVYVSMTARFSEEIMPLILPFLITYLSKSIVVFLVQFETSKFLFEEGFLLPGFYFCINIVGQLIPDTTVQCTNSVCFYKQPFPCCLRRSILRTWKRKKVVMITFTARSLYIVGNACYTLCP